MMDPEDMHNQVVDHERRLDELERSAKQPTGLDGMTLAQLEAMAERLGAAARTIRDAQALLGGPVKARQDDEEPPPRPEVPADAIAAHRLRQLQPPEMAPGTKSQLRPHEMAAKRGLMDQFARADDPNLPDEIRAMERGE